MKFSVRPWLKLALPLFLVLAAYFPSINNPFSRFDDPFIVNVYGLNSTLSFRDIITPGGSFYYRPLINLSYWLDFRLWGMEPTFMHLENILAHLLNVLLVYLIASRLPASLKIPSLPFLSALLFGLHPINSESVNWIAGRTDAFAAMFILSAFYCLIRSVQEQSTRFATLAFGAAFIGVLAKETAIMFIPAAFLVTTRWPVMPLNDTRDRIWRNRNLLMPLVISTGAVFALCLLVYLKRQGDNAISITFKGGPDLFIRMIEAFGFYVKKMFLPLPLNVAIIEIDPLYSFVGIIAVCALLVSFRRSGIPGIFLASAVLFVLPALVVATSSFAWTPYGERYLYIPAAFAVIGCLELFYRLLERWNASGWFVPVSAVIIALALVATLQRGKLWGDNLAMLEDIVVKTPNFGVVRNEYGILLKMAGRYDEAENQFKIALQQKNKSYVDRMIRLNLFGMNLIGKNQDESYQILLKEIGRKADAEVELLKLINTYDEYMLGSAVKLEQRKKIIADIIETNENLYVKTRDPYYLYRSGQLELSIGNKQQAAMMFRKTWENARPEVYYRDPARRLAEKLEAK
ncbi:MAG: glycosyltransferase family 39 protein [Geobacteraceae bacterium]|nr:glycosyltransferase family 39 protein [Geobacteraceae bacterium]